MGVILRGLVSGRRESHVSPSTPLNLPGVSQSFSLYFSHALLPSHCFPSLHSIARSQKRSVVVVVVVVVADVVVVVVLEKPCTGHPHSHKC